jgi:hypothetical protein
MSAGREERRTQGYSCPKPYGPQRQATSGVGHRVGHQITAVSARRAPWEVCALTDSNQSGVSAGEESSSQQDGVLDQSQGQVGEDTPPQDPSAEAHSKEAESSEAENTEVEGVPAGHQTGNKRRLLLGLGTGTLVGIMGGFVLAALIGPGFLTGPGKPDGKVSETTAALASKNPGEMEKVSCRGPDGKPTAQLPPQALSLIQSVKPSGPPRLSLDTEAQAPVALTVSEQGQTQTIPIELVLGVTNGDWCMKGITQAQ